MRQVLDDYEKKEGRLSFSGMRRWLDKIEAQIEHRDKVVPLPVREVEGIEFPPRFVKLTRPLNPGREGDPTPIYFNADKIDFLEAHPDHEGTEITIGTWTIRVAEPIDEVVELLGDSE